MTDLHIHAPQYSYRGLGMDMELLEWLNVHAFPEESKFADLTYAKKAYRIFVDDMVKSTTTRACIFGTLHKDATLLLMELLEDAGMRAYVGKVNMDRNSPDILREESAESASKITEQWILEAERFDNVRQILTPRFIPSCSDELMRELSRLQKKYELPMQSHLSENLGEIAWVQDLCPDSKFYGDAYDQFELFGGECPTIMAHCVHSGEEEVELMKEKNVFVAHCPQSNTNIASGIAPVRMYLEKDLKMGLGSDVAGGAHLSLMRAMTDAIQCSKLRWRMYDQSLEPLKFEEAFYLATKGGGEFFGIAAHQIQCLAADGAGGSQYCKCFHFDFPLSESGDFKEDIAGCAAEQHAVHAVHDAAVSGQKLAEILYAAVALDHRCG
jgi:guanine deaminase